MAITQSAYSVLDRIASIKSKSERATALREELTKNAPLAVYIQYVYHPDVQFDLPEGQPNLRPNPFPDDYGAFYRYLKKLYQYGVNSEVPRKKKELNWQAMLESIALEDVPLMNAVKEKKLPWRTLGKKFVVGTIPELYPADMVQENELHAEEE